MVHFVDVKCRVYEKMHLNHLEIVFGSALGWPLKEVSLVAGDRVVDLDVV